MNEIQDAYENTDYEVVEQGNVELPVSTPAIFGANEPISVAVLQRKLEQGEYAFIAPLSKNGYLSSKVLDCKTNVFFHLKATTSGIRIFPKDNDFSQETLRRVVTTINENVADISHTPTEKTE